LGIKPRRWPSLREICCGVLDGWPVAEVEQVYPDLWQANLSRSDDDFGWPGGETYRGFRNRVLRAIRRIARLHRGGRVAVVTHAGVISQIIGSLAGQPAARWQLFRPAPASLTELRWHGDVCRVLRFDDRRHLRGLWVPDQAADVGTTTSAIAIRGSALGQQRYASAARRVVV
jgi:broad specificity phosphatase PhoE